MNGFEKNDEAIKIYEDEIPEDREINDNPYIFSDTIPLGKHSFADSRQEYDVHCPPPKYMSEALIMKPLPVT